MRKVQEQAMRVGWRIIKDWVRAQMAILETERVKIEEVFLPYLVRGNKTLFQVIEEGRFLLNPGEVTKRGEEAPRDKGDTG